MTSFTRLFSSIKSAYQNINPSTLTGAIDVIVVKQEDGTLRCTPFHVRFGKLGVLQNQQNKVGGRTMPFWYWPLSWQGLYND